MKLAMKFSAKKTLEFCKITNWHCNQCAQDNKLYAIINKKETSTPLESQDFTWQKNSFLL